MRTCFLFKALIKLYYQRALKSNNDKLKGDFIVSKNFGSKPYLFPMPTYMIGTYNEDNTPDVMMMAWGGICAEDMVALNLEADHKTVANLKSRKAFTLAIPGVDTIKESDYLGIVSSNKVANKFKNSGLSYIESQLVDAPIIVQYPVTLECEVVEMQQQPYGLRVLGKIVNVRADDKVLDANGNIDVAKINAFVFDQVKYGYYSIGEKIGQAWHSGADLLKNK